MPNDPSSDLAGLYKDVAAGHLLGYYTREGDFGALTPDDAESIEPVIERFAEALAQVVESFLAFEEGEPPTVFDLLARQIVGLPAAARADVQADPADEPAALVRDAARLEMRLEEFAATVMYAGLEDPQLSPVDPAV